MIRQLLIAISLAVGALGGLGFANESKSAGGTNEIINSIGMKLNLVPSGEFMMGSAEPAEKVAEFFEENGDAPSDDFLRPKADFFRNEHPQHRVRITKPFYMGTTHVTRGQFRQFLKDSGYNDVAKKGNSAKADETDPKLGNEQLAKPFFKQTNEDPVVDVSWNDAVAFCKWLSGKEQRIYRLPTEAEWEYACRAGTSTRYYSGDDPETLAKVAHLANPAATRDALRLLSAQPATAKAPLQCHRIKSDDGYPFTAPVRTFKPNDFGLYDMHGNAYEWCADWYDEGYYAKSPADDPIGPDSGKERVFRGGSFDGPPYNVRSARRGGVEPDSRSNGVGFRVATSRQQ